MYLYSPISILFISRACTLTQTIPQLFNTHTVNVLINSPFQLFPFHVHNTSTLILTLPINPNFNHNSLPNPITFTHTNPFLNL